MRRWVLLGVAVAVLLAVAWWLFLISPRNAQIAQARDDLETAQQQEVGLMAQIAQLESIRQAEAEYLAGIGQMDALIPEQPLLDEFFDQLYQLTVSTGTSLLNIAPAQPVVVEGSELRQFTVAVTIEGDFYEVLGFLYGLMDLDRLVRVDAISVSSSPDETGATVLNVSTSLRLFTLSDLVPVPTTIPAETGTEGTGTEGAGEAAGGGAGVTSTILPGEG